MLSLIIFASLAVSQVYGAALPRSARLSRRRCHKYDTANNEPEATFKARFKQLQCKTYEGSTNEDQQTFFKSCCHPLKNTQAVTDLPALCGLGAPASDPPPAAPAAADPAPAAPVDQTPAPATPANTTPAPADPAPETPVNTVPAPSNPAPETPVNTVPAPSDPVTPVTPVNTAPAPSSNEITGGHGTFFYQNGNPGACGEYHNDGERLVAIDEAMWNNGANCGRTVHITDTDTGKTVDAVVKDMCPTCDNGQSLDLSLGAFEALASLDKGLLQISYHFA